MSPILTSPWFKWLIVFVSYTILPIYGILIAIPLVILRLTSLYSASLFKPNLKRAINPESGLLSFDDIYTEPRHTVLGVLYTDGPVQKEAVIIRMEQVLQEGKKLVLHQNFKDFYSIAFQFPELSQQLISHWGQYFWGDCPHFKLKDHISTSPNVTTYDELQTEKNRCYRKPFMKQCPLWEIVLLPNYKHAENDGGEKNAFILRIHHILGDGLAFSSLLDGIAGKKQVIKNTQEDKSRWKDKLREWFPSRSFLSQYQMITSFFQDLIPSSWVRPESEWSPMVYSGEGRISMTILKTAAFNISATVTETLSLAVTRAVGDYIIPAPGSDTVSSIFILPKPKHPLNLTNHAYVTTLTLPIKELNPARALERLKAEFELKRSTAPVLNVAFLMAGILLQALPFKYVKKFRTQMKDDARVLPIPKLSSLCFSTAALPSEPWNLFGVKVTGVCIMIDIAYHIPVMIVLAGYAGTMHISLRGRADVMRNKGKPKEIIDKIVDSVYELAKTKRK